MYLRCEDTKVGTTVPVVDLPHHGHHPQLLGYTHTAKLRITELCIRIRLDPEFFLEQDPELFVSDPDPDKN